MVKEVNKEHKNVKMTRKKKRSGICFTLIIVCGNTDLSCMFWIGYAI